MIQCEGLVKIYKTADIEAVALQGLDLSIDYGELMAIIGNSGSGKSTLLNMLGGLDRPSAGKLMVDGQDLFTLGEKELVAYKRQTVGFVWQNNARNLIPYLTAIENVELPMLLAGKRRCSRARELLDAVGLGKRMMNRLSELSGGEQQRVAIAIALANEPRLLLADEPTGSLDTATSDQILDLLRSLNRSSGITIVIVTHDSQLAKKVDRVVQIRDGKTSAEMIRRVSYAEEMALLDTEHNGQTSESHVEFAIVDRAGRLQIPAGYMDAAGFKGSNKVRVEKEEGRILLYPPDDVKPSK